MDLDGSYDDGLSNIVRVLKKARKHLREGEYDSLGRLSDETIDSATVHQDALNVIVAVLVYSMYKVFQRENYRRMKGWDRFYALVIEKVDLMVKSGQKGDREGMLQVAGEIRHSLNFLYGDLGDYIKDVFRKAEINKAFRLYEHGISGARTANLLGVSLWDLSSYIGQAKVNEANSEDSIHFSKRYKKLERFFG